MRHRLIVEVDGGQHNFDEHARHDGMRDQGFDRSGSKVLRFWNNDVDRNLEGVLAIIDSTLRQATPPGGPADRHPPLSGEG
jgi:very-short-patch-repair endonuclease